MRRPLTTCASMLSTVVLAVALAPSTVFAQDPAPAAAKPAEPKVAFATDAGLLLVQIKGDQTAVFEDLIAKLKAGAGKTEDATVKAQLTSLKVYKTSEGAGGNALYVIVIDPAAKNAEYELFSLLTKTMTDDEKRAPETAEYFKKATGAFAAGYNKLSLTPVK